MNRSSFFVLVCALAIVLVGCSTKGPRSVRFTRQVDEAQLEQLTKQGGSVVLLADVEFWTGQERKGGIPIAQRPQTFILGPGAAEMAGKMLARMFDEVVTVRRVELVEDPAKYDFVIRLVQGSFDDRTLFLPLFSNQRYRLDLGAEVYLLDDSFVGKVEARGSESFWLMNLLAADPFEGDARLLEKASKTLNAAVQESLFELMQGIEPLTRGAPEP